MTEMRAKDHAIIGLQQRNRQNLLVEDLPGLGAGKLDKTVVQAVFWLEGRSTSGLPWTYVSATLTLATSRRCTWRAPRIWCCTTTAGCEFRS